ncbi:MAG: TRAP transporter small permease [Lachnospiraceae bacterium]|nr:TRAP transporter small permease [Lachnospiraceae bacterium]
MILLGIFMLAMVVVMCYQVILRYAFNNSNVWSEELTRFLFVWVSLLGSFVAIRRNSHLKVEFLVELMKGKFKKYFTILTDIAVILFIIYLIPLSYELTLSTMKNISGGLKVPMAVGYAAIPVGSLLMLLGMIEQLLYKFFDKKVEVNQNSEVTKA